MTKRPNHFEKALAEAEKRLAKALNERSMAQETLADLAIEIPSLQQTIAALNHQIKPVGFSSPVERLSAGDETQRVVGSTPTPDTIPEILDEDSLLPDVDGTPLIED